MNIEKKDFLLNIFLGMVSLFIDFCTEIIQCVLFLPKIIFIFAIGYFIYKPEELLDVNFSFLVDFFLFVNLNVSSFFGVFLSLAFLSLLMNYFVGRKKFLLGEILAPFFSKKKESDNLNLKGE